LKDKSSFRTPKGKIDMVLDTDAFNEADNQSIINDLFGKTSDNAIKEET
jgi:hypothetical protein